MIVIARSRISAASLAALLSYGLGIGAVVAEPPPAARSVITYSDLDLVTDAGIRTLYSRVKGAAESVCLRETIRHPGIDERSRYAFCVDAAVAQAVKQLNQPRLAALQGSRSQ